MSSTSPRTGTPRAQGRAPSIELRLLSATPGPAEQPLVPNLIIPGVSHAGAGMLSARLGRHPEICLPDSKRIGHFTPLRYGRAIQAPLDDYDRHFARWSGQRYRIETSPGYFDGGAPLIGALADRMPGLRVVLLLRDPSHRLWTSYLDKLTRGRLPRAMSYETFVDRCLALRANDADRFEGNRYFRTLSSGFYIEHLPAWLDAFGQRARVVFSEDLQQAPDAQVGALFDWLGLNPSMAAPECTEEPRVGGYPPPQSGQAFNRRLWPVFPRRPRSWRAETASPADVVPRLPRQSDRVRSRVTALYASANRDLAVLLRDRGYTALPGWLG